ncbi:MAG: TetR family transcriptional regulator [Steroidobacteraceae bacterium]
MIKRRAPQQARARARVERILAAAEKLITRGGVVKLRMRDIAGMAGIPMGSIYQYFSSREDVVRALIERYHGQVEAFIAETLDPPRTFEQFRRAVAQAWQAGYEFFRDTAGFRELWFGAQMWQDLRTMDIDDTLVNADLIARRLAKFLPNLDEQVLRDFCIVYVDSAGSIIRTGYSLDGKARERVLAAHENIIDSHLRSLWNEDRRRRKAMPPAVAGSARFSRNKKR